MKSKKALLLVGLFICLLYFLKSYFFSSKNQMSFEQEAEKSVDLNAKNLSAKKERTKNLPIESRIEKSYNHIDLCLELKREKKEGCEDFFDLSENEQRYLLVQKKIKLLEELRQSDSMVSETTKDWLIENVLWEEPVLQDKAVDLFFQSTLLEEDISQITKPLLDTLDGKLHQKVYQLIEKQGFIDAESSWDYYKESMAALPLDERTELLGQLFGVFSRSALSAHQIKKKVKEIKERLPEHSASYKQLQYWLEKN